LEEKLKYYVKLGNKKYAQVHLESVSPTGQYFIGWHTKCRSSIYFYQTVRKKGGKVYGKIVTSREPFDDINEGFGKVVWFEEYGFVKIIFHVWCTMESESKRIYFDRDLYEQKKIELHGE